MKQTTMWLVRGVHKNAELEIGGQTRELPLIWADGMCGVLPVFSTEESARKYSGGEFELDKIRTVKKKKKKKKKTEGKT